MIEKRLARLGYRIDRFLWRLGRCLLRDPKLRARAKYHQLRRREQDLRRRWFGKFLDTDSPEYREYCRVKNQSDRLRRWFKETWPNSFLFD